jgi:hypothetical protein
MSILRAIVMALAIVDLTSCATTSRHQFAEPTPDWQVRNGQLLYRAPKITLIGDVLVRSSRTGDFELTFSKGPGVTLLMIRQDASFADQRWSGAARLVRSSRTSATTTARLAEVARQTQSLARSTLVRYVAGNETFLFRF